MAVKPPAILLAGAAGSGKTYSLSTLIEAGLEVFCLFTDPGGEESFIDSIMARKLDMKKAHWATVPLATTTWEDFGEISAMINRLSYSSLGDIKNGINKSDFMEFRNLLTLMSNFKCERTGESYGPVDKFGPDKALVLDSITGLGVMIKHLVVGAKPTLHQGEWGIAMTHQEEFVNAYVGTKCLTVATAHMELVKDEELGSVKLMPSFLGNKLAPKMPRIFSDVIEARSDEGKFYWNTVSGRANLKARNLPLSEKIEPSFVPIVEKWRTRLEATKVEEEEAETTETE